MAIMVPILAFGAMFTMIMPLTDRRSLEELTQEDMNRDIDTAEELFTDDINFKNFENFEMVQNNGGYEEDETLEKYSNSNKGSQQPGSSDIFAEKAAAARRAAALARAEVREERMLL